MRLRNVGWSRDVTLEDDAARRILSEAEIKEISQADALIREVLLTDDFSKEEMAAMSGTSSPRKSG